MTDLAIKASRRGISRPGRPWKLIVGALLLVALAAACGPAASTAVPEPTAALLATAAPTPAPAATAADADVPPAITPAVTVADQAIAAGMVTVAEVVSAGPGWLVIHADRDGAPGPVLGYSPVVDGESAGVMVMIDPAQATGTLYAMLHTDAGTVGTYEFPGADVPVVVGDEMVSPAFAVTGGLPEPTTEMATAKPTVESTAEMATAEPAATSGATGAVASGEAEVELEDFQFSPKVLTVKVGTEVKWGNRDDVRHTVTSDTGVFDSGSLQKGEEFSYTFAVAGEYPYYCIPHGGPGGVGMSGTIIVVP